MTHRYKLSAVKMAGSALLYLAVGLAGGGCALTCESRPGNSAEDVVDEIGDEVEDVADEIKD